VANFATGTAGVADTIGQFATGVVDTGGNLPPMSMTQAANLLPVSTTPMTDNGKNIRLLTSVNLKEKNYLYVNSTTQRCSTKINKNFSD
jgi:hypothetical protein